MSVTMLLMAALVGVLGLVVVGAFAAEPVAVAPIGAADRVEDAGLVVGAAGGVHPAVESAGAALPGGRPGP